MEHFFQGHQGEILWSVIILVLLTVIRFVGSQTVRKIGRVGNIEQVRVLRISKYLSLLYTFLAVVALSLVWGINFKELGLLFSSVFAVIGVALFAQWSILSNVTAGVILFFAFPFKIGDRIQIMDKDLQTEGSGAQESFRIEDIKAYHVRLRSDSGQLITYPNNMMLQKAVTLLCDDTTDTDMP